MYEPTATAIPPGSRAFFGIHLLIRGFTASSVTTARARVKMAKITANANAHSFAIGGRPFPVTNLAVNIHTYPVGTGKRSPGMV